MIKIILSNRFNLIDLVSFFCMTKYFLEGEFLKGILFAVGLIILNIFLSALFLRPDVDKAPSKSQKDLHDEKLQDMQRISQDLERVLNDNRQLSKLMQDKVNELDDAIREAKSLKE